ncbi:MAG: hypothetical protein WKF66_16975 [Pedobacter sp.]
MKIAIIGFNFEIIIFISDYWIYSIMERRHIKTFILFIVITIGSVVHVFYSQKLSKFNGVDQLLVASSILFLVRIWSSWNHYLNTLTFILFAGGTLWCLNVLHNDYANRQLHLYGKKTNAVVQSVIYRKGYKSAPGIIIRFAYTSGGNAYIHSIVDDIEVERRFSVGDTLPIIYSSIDPDLFKEVGK